MVLFLGAAIAGGIGAIAKTGFGIYQMIKGNKMAKENQRPTYEIPEEVKQNLTQSQMMALEGMPAEQQKLYVQNTQRGMAGQLRGLSSRKAGLTGVTAAAQQEQDSYQNLLAMDVQARNQNQQQLMQARGDMASFKDRQFDVNKMQPYMMKEMQAQGMMGAGAQNMMGGFSDASSMASNAMIGSEAQNIMRG